MAMHAMPIRHGWDGARYLPPVAIRIEPIISRLRSRPTGGVSRSDDRRRTSRDPTGAMLISFRKPRPRPRSPLRRLHSRAKRLRGDGTRRATETAMTTTILADPTNHPSTAEETCPRRRGRSPRNRNPLLQGGAERRFCCC
jgi:hypothetical protein